MIKYIPEEVMDEIENLKSNKKYSDAMKLVNSILSDDPNNEDALLQVADIYYRSWEINKASKAIDFFNSKKDLNDPLWLYIKWILEMEKNNWQEAKAFLQKGIILTNAENHEILRCYWLCEYRYGNREKWINFLRDSFTLNNKDAEVIFNLIEIYILEHKYEKANNMIKYFHKNHDNLITIDKDIEHYDKKINLFEEFVRIQKMFN